MLLSLRLLRTSGMTHTSHLLIHHERYRLAICVDQAILLGTLFVSWLSAVECQEQRKLLAANSCQETIFSASLNITDF